MNPFRKRFVRLLEADLPGSVPALGNAPTGDPTAAGNPATPTPALTNDASLQASLDSTAAAGEAAAGNNPAEKLAGYQNELKKFADAFVALHDEIAGTAGQDGLNRVWNKLNPSLSKISSLIGLMGGDLDGLKVEVPVAQQQANKQKAKSS